MFKVIWNQEKHKQVSEKIKSDNTFKILTSNDGLHDGEIGIFCDEKNLDKLKPLLKDLELEQLQMVFPTQKGWIQVHIDKVTYIESYGEDIMMHMVKKSTEEIKQPLYQLEHMLENHGFVRIGKSFIVNLRKIRYIHVTYNAKLQLELTNREIIYVSRSYVSKFKHALGIK